MSSFLSDQWFQFNHRFFHRRMKLFIDRNVCGTLRFSDWERRQKEKWNQIKFYRLIKWHQLSVFFLFYPMFANALFFKLLYCNSWGVLHLKFFFLLSLKQNTSKKTQEAHSLFITDFSDEINEPCSIRSVFGLNSLLCAWTLMFLVSFSSCSADVR